MRHGDKINNLSRTASHRKALLSNLTCQLITHKRIVTTIAKAKALRVYAEPLITKAKENSTHQHRVVFSYLQDKEAVKELFGTVAEKVAGRPGGYIRIIKLGTRTGDNAELALIELVDFNEVYSKTTDARTETSKRTRRGGRGKKPAATETGTPEAPGALTPLPPVTTTAESPTQEPVSTEPVVDTPEAGDAESSNQKAPE